MANEAEAPAPDPAVVAKARAMGWQPKEEFRGSQDKWIDAPAFVERGEQLMPILQANNRQLMGKVNALESQLAESNQRFAAAQSSLDELTAANREIQQDRAKDKKAEILEGIRQARTDGDIDRENQLTDQLSEINVRLRSQQPKTPKQNGNGQPPPNQPSAPPPLSAEMQQWMNDNSWYGTDEVRTSVAHGVAEKLRKDPANKGLLNRAFLDKVAEETSKILDGNQSPSVDRVEGGRPSGGSGGGGRSFNDLPQAAKDACLKQEKRFVGPGKSFKTAAEWRNHYVNVYFKE